MSVIGEPIGKSVVEVGLNDSKLVSGLTNLNAKMKLADNTWKESLSTFKQSDRSIEKLSVSVKGMTDKLKVQSQIVEAHKQKVAKLTSEYGETHTKVIKANAELKKQEATFGNLKRSVGEVTQELKDLKKAEQLSKSPWAQRQKELQAYSDKMTAIADKAMGIGQNMSLAVSAPIVGMGAASIKVAGEYSAAESQFKTVFGNMEKEAKSSLDAISKETGLLPNSLRGTYTQMAAFAKTTGASTKDALDLTSRATLAAADSAAFYDKSIGEVSENLQSFLKGNYENDAALGISATETTRNAKANELYGKSFIELSEQQKQLTLLKMVEDGNKLAGAMGQAAREQDQLGTQTSNLKTAWADFQNEVGKPLLPVAIDTLKSLSATAKDASNWFNGLSDGSKKAVLGIGGIAAAAGPSLIAFGMMAKGAGAVAGAYSKLSGPIKLFTKGAEGAGKATGIFARSSGLLSRGLGLLGGPIGIALTAVTTLYGAFKLAYKHVDWFREGVDNTGKLLKEVAGSIDFDWVGDLGNGIKDTTGKLARFGFEISPIGMISKNTFKVVGDSVKKATDTVDVFGKGVSKSTKKVLQEYTDLSMKASKKLEDLKINHKTIGDQQYKEVVSIYSKINADVTKKLGERHKRETDGLRKLLVDTKGISNQEKQRIVIEAQSGNAAEVKAAKTINKQIMDIYKKAKTEKRALTRTEENKIANLQKQMDQKVVASLSNSEKEQRIILGRLKSNKKTLSIQAASEVIKASAKERDESIKNARKKRDKTIDEAIYQRDITKNISKEQADKIIKDAERQYSGSKKNAEKQHKSVVNEAKKQNKGVRTEIDSQTGRVLTQWEKTKKNVSLSASFLTSYVNTQFKKSYENTSKWMSETKNSIGKKWSEIKANVSKFAEDTKKAAVDKFESMYDGATKWISNIGKFITDSKKGITDKASSMGKSVANGAIGGLNGMIDGINSISSKIMDKNLLSKIPKLSTGTVKDGAIAKPTLAVVGDKGPGNGPGGFKREIIHRANGDMELTPATDTLVHLNKGDKVYNGTQTYSLMQKGLIPRFSIGTAIKNGWENTMEFGSTVKESVVDASKMVGKIAGDVFEYIENPSKLVDIVLGKLGSAFDNVGGITGDLGKSAFTSIKNSLVSKVKEWLEEFSGGDVDGSEILNWPKTTPYSPNSPVPGYPASFNGGRHYGIDLGIPSGTTIHAPTSGTVSQQYNYGGGIVARLISGKIAQYFLHLSKVLKKGPVKQGDAIAKSGNSGAWTTGDHLHYQVENPASSELTNRNTMDPVAFLKSKVSSGKDTTGKSWASEIRRAASQMKVKITDGDVRNISAQINRESSGNQNIVQSSAVWDKNTASGNPAQGLLQYIPQTFRAYAVPGHTNIRSGYDQLLAFFNNSNWRNDNPGGRSGWGPSGVRRFANGGFVKDESYIAGEEYEEAIIPMDPKRRNRANQLLAEANYKVNGPIKLSKGTSNKTHRVKWGDTLWDISRKNGTTVKALQLLNGIKNHLIYPGQIIKLTGSITNLSNNVSKQTKVKSKPKASTSYISRAQSLYNTGKSILNRGKSSNKVTGKDDVNLGTLIMNNTKNLGSLSLEAAQKNIDTIVKKINSMITSSTGKISSLNNKISKSTNKKTIANARNDIQSYKAQIASLKKLKQNKVLKTNYLKNLIKEKSSLTAKLNQRTEEGKALQEEKTNYRSSIASNLQNYAGFGVAKGHTSRDFVSFMKYRLSKMKEYASNVRKLKSMGLDPILLRELLAGGIENSMPRVAALVKGGKGYIGQINTLQKSINAEVNKISSEQANFGYNSDINANNKQIQTLKNQQKKIDKKKVVYLNERKRITKSNVKANPKKPISNTSRTVTTMRTHNIKWGDTLGHIAQRYGTTVNELKKANNLKSDMIYAGRTLKVPTKKVVQLPKTQTALDRSTKYIMDTAKRYQLVNNSSKLNNLQKQLNKIKSDKDKKNDVVITKLEKTLRDLTKKYDKQDDVVKLLQQLVNKNPDILLNGVKLTKEMDKLLATNSKINARRKAR
ncbi:LysM peptidoglycan-binding domain-containing protein [Macrococcoides caseolyticum]|uniref:LysM peptidoglycan-binding domain-containing protein n=2 Tax=Macrococcoides caseolyticum TaxID=69966 RepID=UPI000C332010|nr:LysM peptidoglycan-binding domain-containing protein [Macrococcus caseolyticus]PKE51602.1 hypothetical protein CW672_00440 [Macrococcus caseolyticus]PKE73075.1 hypothetical protein CW665_01195 [Macrococcus caseolyticus]PKF41540.1 hypothetical protein CW661_03935 [Macrococcus caseolyticus]